MSKNSAKKIVDNFLETLTVDAVAEVTEDGNEINIKINGKDASLLIGFHGDNLQALRHLLSIVLRKNLGSDISVWVDVSDYLAKKEDRIKSMAQRAMDKFEQSGEPQDLRDLNSYERRIVHSYVTEMGYKSESIGEGYDRHILISK